MDCPYFDYKQCTWVPSSLVFPFIMLILHLKLLVVGYITFDSDSRKMLTKLIHD